MKTFKLLVIALTLFLFSFISGDKSEYTLPAYGRTIISVDLDLDGDIDIVSGHIYYWQTEWS
ncbi:MAG: hypothetical protein KDC09_17630, partial [Bacteroidales bacterium]|nr:hypothetical protein [Bacteroidales bacterium]